LKAGGEEQYSIIEKDHKKGLVNQKGRVLIPPEYDDLGWTNGKAQLLENVIGFKKNGLWGILNTKNERVTEPVYNSLSKFNESWIVASKKLPYNSNIVYGVINAKGKAEVAFEYHQIYVHMDKMITCLKKNNNFVYGILDDKGKPVLQEKFDRIVALTENLYEVYLNEKIGIFNSDGENIVDFHLDSVKVLNPEFVITYQDGRKGLISENGDFTIAPEYKDINITPTSVRAQKFPKWKVFNASNELQATYHYDFISPKGKDIYRVRVGQAEALIHKSDSLLTPFSKLEIQSQFEDWIVVKQDGKSGILNLSGDVLFEPLYDSVRYAKGVFLVKSIRDGERGWRMINADGKIKTDHVYDELDWLGDSFFKAKRDGYWGVVNNRGKEIIYCKYDSLIEYSEGRLLVDFLGENGILNMDGSWEILPQQKEIEIVDPMRYLIRSPYGSYVAYYPETRDFEAEYFLYKDGDRYLEKTLDLKYGLRDELGKRIIPPMFDEISPLQEDSIYYARSAGGYSFYTKSGKAMIRDDDRFQEISDMTEEFIGVKIDGRWGFVDINGKLRIANQYENVGPFNEGLAPMKIIGRWGYLDKREDIVVQPGYDTVYIFKDGLCEVVEDGKFGLINAKGKEVLECEYDNIKRIENGGFLVERNNKYGLVNDKGRLIILPRFDRVLDLKNGYVIVSRKGKHGLLSNNGVSVIPMIYDDFMFDSINDVYLAAETAEWIEFPIP
jgi:hypothetical protein